MTAKHFLFRLIALFCLISLPACGDKPSFSQLAANDTLPAPAVALAALDGLPPEAASQFTEAFRISARARGLRIVQGNFSDGLRLTGLFGSRAEGGQVHITYDWRLVTQKGNELMQLSGSQDGPADQAYPPVLLSRAAETLAETLSSKLLALGFSTRAAGIPPPPEAFSLAGPDAEKDIDYETLLGPGMTADAAVPAPEVSPAPPVEKVASSPAAKGPAIRAIALTGVKGAPGRGNEELRAALKRVLQAGGWPVFDAARPDALQIEGLVELGPPQGPNQRVALAWVVKKPDGSEVGTVRQANDVPAGSLNTGWGETADFAAQAAAQGIADLVQRLR